MTRRSDWRHRLELYLNEVSRRPFRPGHHDCALFAAGACHAMTGTDPARGWRGYRSLEAGRAKLKEKGFDDHIALAASLMPEIDPVFAQVGDIAVINIEGPGDTGNRALGVVQGASIYVPGLKGIALVPLSDATRAFRP